MIKKYFSPLRDGVTNDELIAEIKKRILIVQLEGAAGTLSVYGEKGES